jgi:hypothetical protein
MKPDIKDKLLDELLENYSGPGDLLGPDGLLTELKKRLINRVLEEGGGGEHEQVCSGGLRTSRASRLGAISSSFSVRFDGGVQRA